MRYGFVRTWPWWKDAIIGLYILGYWGFLITAGVHVWPRLPLFFDWFGYMLWQLLYAIVWPLWLFL